MKLLDLYKETDIDLEKAMTLSTNNGGVVTAQIGDALLFIEEMKIHQELNFLHYLVTSKDKPTQESITSFLKHLFFDGALSKQFVQWQRNYRAA